MAVVCTCHCTLSSTPAWATPHMHNGWCYSCEHIECQMDGVKLRSVGSASRIWEKDWHHFTVYPFKMYFRKIEMMKHHDAVGHVLQWSRGSNPPKSLIIESTDGSFVLAFSSYNIPAGVHRRAPIGAAWVERHRETDGFETMSEKYASHLALSLPWDLMKFMFLYLDR